MKLARTFALSAAGLALLAATLPAHAQQSREAIRIVGSSTVFPFSTAVAENFSRETGLRAPIVESTGTGGGFKLFCEGVGAAYPDISNASRAIKASERELCAQNGVTEITEITVGYDGIVLANARTGFAFDLSREDIFKALAAKIILDGKVIDNPYVTWDQINADLPAKKIRVLGPPPTSGTRDAFVELVMEVGGESYLEKANYQGDDFEQTIGLIREDGAYIDAGEHDNLIVQKLMTDPDSLGIFGYSYLDQNRQFIQGVKVDGVAPEFEAIADGDYVVSRPLFFYVKDAHFDLVPTLGGYMQSFASEDAIGDYGYLVDKGLIPMPEEQREALRVKVKTLSSTN